MHRRIVIVAGQSNATGVYGGPRFFAPSERDREIGISWRHVSTSDGVVPLQMQTVRTPGAHNTALPVKGFGPEVTFARTLDEHRTDDDRLVVVKHSEDGTTLHEDWSADDGRLYVSLVQHVREVADGLTRDGDDVTIGSLLWVQGESDVAKFAAHYEADLRRLLTALRRDLGADSMPSVISRIHMPLAPATERALVRTAQATVATADPYACWIDTDDLPLDKIGIHLKGEGLRELGTRAAHALLDLERTIESHHAR